MEDREWYPCDMTRTNKYYRKKEPQHPNNDTNGRQKRDNIEGAFGANSCIEQTTVEEDIPYVDEKLQPAGSRGGSI